jgi:hypothetical protein
MLSEPSKTPHFISMTAAELRQSPWSCGYCCASAGRGLSHHAAEPRNSPTIPCRIIPGCSRVNFWGICHGNGSRCASSRCRIEPWDKADASQRIHARLIKCMSQLTRVVALPVIWGINRARHDSRPPELQAYCGSGVTEELPRMRCRIPTPNPMTRFFF